MMNRVLVTGVAGFIGFHLSKRMLAAGIEVVGVDNMNDYYDPSLKRLRIRELQKSSIKNPQNFKFVEINLADRAGMEALFAAQSFDVVLHMAAQAGVRHSIDNPHVYSEANLVGFLNVLEGCRQNAPKHFICASSSSVYGMHTNIPFQTDQRTDFPVSLYAATKKSNEVMAHAYAHLYDLPTTCLRFFTVYGPFGRPDMAYFKFTKAILSGQSIDVYNNGEVKRDFTFIDDVVEGVMRLLEKPPARVRSDLSHAQAPYRIYNVGNNDPIPLSRFIAAIETATGVEAIKNFMPMQPGDVPVTFANVDDLVEDIDFSPDTSIEEGIAKFVGWYRQVYPSG